MIRDTGVIINVTVYNVCFIFQVLWIFSSSGVMFRRAKRTERKSFEKSVGKNRRVGSLSVRPSVHRDMSETISQL